MEDDLTKFPSVVRIPDAMLRRFEPTNPVLVEYLKTINPSIETGVLFPKVVGGRSKKSKVLKKNVKASPSKATPELVEKLSKVTPKKVVKPVSVPIPTNYYTHCCSLYYSSKGDYAFEI